MLTREGRVNIGRYRVVFRRAAARHPGARYQRAERLEE